MPPKTKKKQQIAQRPPKQLRSRTPGEVLRRMMAIRAEDLDSESRELEVSFSSETDKIRFWGTPEILLHEDGSMDIKPLRDVGAVLLNHDPDRIVGRPEDIRLDRDERKGRARIVFDSDEESERVLGKVRSGSLRGVSVGFAVDRWQILDEGESWESPEGRTFDGPAYLATQWRVVEFSLTPIPADASVGVGRSSDASRDDPGQGTLEEYCMDPKVRAKLEKLGLSKTASDEEAIDFLDQLETKKRTDPPETPPKPPDEGGEPPPSAEARRAAGAAVAAERERVSDIREMCGHYECTRELADELIQKGTTVAMARKVVIDRLAKERPVLSGPRRIEFGEEERTKFARTAEDWLAHRVGRLRDPDKDKLAGRLNAIRSIDCFSLLDLARESCRRANIHVAGASRDELIKRAMAHSTSDFPSILENVAQKALLQSWAEAPSTWEPLAKVINAVDFKSMSRVKLGDAGDLVKTLELVPMSQGSLAEAKETYAIDTYTKRFGISRQAIINDDLSAFDSIPGLMGAAARRLPNKLFWDLVISAAGIGPTMAEDATALFATTHTSGSNYLTGAGTDAINVANLGAVKALMRKQKGLAAANEVAPILNIMPSFLIVPAAKETEALQFISSTVDPAKSNMTPNPFASAIQVIVEPRLDGGTNGLTAWIVVASPSAIAGAEVAFLNGQREPTLIRVDGTDVLGIEWGLYLDVGVKFVEHRGWARSKGAA